LIFIGKGYFFFLTRVGSFLYWVDLAHLRQLTAPPKPPEAKHAADCFLDLKGIGLAARGLTLLLLLLKELLQFHPAGATGLGEEQG